MALPFHLVGNAVSEVIVSVGFFVKFVEFCADLLFDLCDILVFMVKYIGLIGKEMLVIVRCR